MRVRKICLTAVMTTSVLGGSLSVVCLTSLAQPPATAPPPATAQPPAVPAKTAEGKSSDAPPAANKPGQSLGINSAKNFRDIGGYKTRDGMLVRTGRLYRSNALAGIRGEDMKKLTELGLKNDYDFRHVDERANAPDQLPPGVNNIWLNVMIDSQVGRVPKVADLLANPTQANADWGDGKMEDRFYRGYRDFVSLSSAKKAYHELFVDLTQDENLPAVIHCSSGKDRTGWPVAALLSLLGVPEEVIFEDYLKSNDNLMPGYRGMIDSFTRSGGQASILPAMLGVKEEYLKTAFDEVKTKHGTIEIYFKDALDIDAAGQQKLKEQFLVREK